MLIYLGHVKNGRDFVATSCISPPPHSIQSFSFAWYVHSIHQKSSWLCSLLFLSYSFVLHSFNLSWYRQLASGVVLDFCFMTTNYFHYFYALPHFSGLKVPYQILFLAHLYEANINTDHSVASFQTPFRCFTCLNRMFPDLWFVIA